MQPCDVGYFKPLKASWDRAVENWEADHLGEVINKYGFAQIFRIAWENSLKMSTLINSFRASGICPLNRSAIKDDSLAPSSVYIHDNSDDNSDDPFAELDDSDDEGQVIPPPSESELLSNFESTLSSSDLELYEHRFEEGYDITTDKVYLEWKSLKQNLTSESPPTSVPLASLQAGVAPVLPIAVRGRDQPSKAPPPYSNTGASSSMKAPLQAAVGSTGSTPASSKVPLQAAVGSTGATPPLPSSNLSSCFTEVLVYPKAKPTKRGKTRTAHLPKHLTSDEFFKYFEDKKKQKEKEEEEKERNRLIRQENARKKQEEKEEKARIRKRKQEEKERNEEEKKRKQEERQRKKRTSTSQPAGASPYPSTSQDSDPTYEPPRKRHCQ